MVSSPLRSRLYLLLHCIVCGIGPVLEPTSAHAQGGPPLLTDDPGTPGNRHWEVNLAATVEHTADASLYEAPLTDFNYGLGGRIQLKLELPLLVENSTGTRTGLGNPVVGVKLRFLEDSSSGLAISTYPQFEFPSPILPLDESENEHALLLPLELAIPWGRLGINVEAGYRIIDGADDEVIYGLALGHDVTGTLELLAECNGSSAPARLSELLCQLGTRKEIGAHFSLLSAVGRAVAGDSDELTDFQIYVGLQSRW